MRDQARDTQGLSRGHRHLDGDHGEVAASYGGAGRSGAVLDVHRARIDLGAFPVDGVATEGPDGVGLGRVGGVAVVVVVVDVIEGGAAGFAGVRALDHARVVG